MQKYVKNNLVFKKPKVRVNYQIDKNLKEKIKKSKKYKSISYYIREAVLDFLSYPLTKDEIHNVNTKIETDKLKKSTVLLFETDIDNINKIKNRKETYQFDTVYCITIIVYGYAIKENLI